MSSSDRPNPDDLKKTLVQSGRDELLSGELFWADHQKWLESRGYMLRPRYRPGWIPSWKGTNKWKRGCEDGRYILSFDRCHSYLGRSYCRHQADIPSKSPDEVEINKFFSSGSRASQPRNHCIPVHEILQVPEKEEMVLMVMPFVRPYDNPRFETIGEAVEFFRQIFEGLQFMHEHHVAHRDCCSGNIMTEATGLYPNGYHPIDLDMNRDYHGYAKHYTRTERPPKYYLVDFGISLRFESENRPLAEPVRGRDKTVPEFQGEAYYEPSDPFLTDIYYFGNMIKTDFTDVNFGFEFMSPLIADMTQDTPSRRPTIDEVVSRFDTLYRSLSASKLRSRIVQREFDLLSWWRESVHFFRKIRYILQGISPVPKATRTKRI